VQHSFTPISGCIHRPAGTRLSFVQRGSGVRARSRHRSAHLGAHYRTTGWITAHEIDPARGVEFITMDDGIRRALGAAPGEVLRMVLREQIDRALKLDPFNVTIHSFYAIDLLLARRYEDAITQARKTLKMQPDNGVASTALILSLYMNKQYEQAVTAAAALYASAMFGWPEIADALKKGYAEVGYAGALRRIADLETAKYGTLPGVANDAATNYLMGGDTARAFEWFEKAYEVRDPNLPYLNCYPILDPLRGDPRLQSLLRRIGLPQ